ncbi:hypothetical protein MIDIC_350003 [Alphaproteobacteria bacterium]
MQSPSLRSSSEKEWLIEEKQLHAAVVPDVMQMCARYRAKCMKECKMLSCRLVRGSCQSDSPGQIPSQRHIASV